MAGLGVAPKSRQAVGSSLRLTRRGRAVLTAFCALPIVAGAFVFGLNGEGAVASSDLVGVDFRYITVHAGQSLWTLAEELAPQSDPRDVVDAIVALNQLPGAGLEPGQRLAIPARYEAAR
ncbi:LysM peptidoglycan-binding domain-containing protein [Rathayibacter toxicus]|uniref:LysM peptidoglycan-binding domain-containing protein n=1 Tax=Rathayibacter toxicus TaxID=145458 RepID=A0A0U1PTG9_9MICO|nr:hypothetical protein APU90_01940 [Rathayibacter toxicus]KKM45850.1 hypothetical protein VT73_05335 [Rathayibacter toxicus]PPG22343.1 LysM peptidoglycan-binding domain-containing protein [Rathayibacter toxicus]PPG47177.1 LysM peptidoglycan-binding domain-containing protein [Rathayibacter toxicus]PPH24361.1 LysM peptidoglycan-binding domain-containing protein [Rathayibacter toxicus]